MTFDEAVKKCHIRSAIYRKGRSWNKYWKNNTKSLDEQVPEFEKAYNDWEEYDPQNEENYHIPA